MANDYMIRRAVPSDLPTILKIYESARQYMAATGNASQWAGGYPQLELLEGDIEAGQLYVYEAAQLASGDAHAKVHGVFAFIIGDDPTYRIIENGQWLNDEPYGAIHRVASDGKCTGVLAACVNFCAGEIDNLRIDTHADNRVMQEGVSKLGFEKCGRIYVADGSPRIAYHKVVR